MTRDDLEKLNTVYWGLDAEGEESKELADAVSKIYYFCERSLDDSDRAGLGVDASDGTDFSLPDEVIAKTGKTKYKARLHRRVSETQ